MLNLQFDPFPELTTAHLVLRKLTTGDVSELFILRSDDAVNQYIDRPKTGSIEEAKQFILKINEGIANNELVYWVLTLKNKQKLIGTIGFWNIDSEKLCAEIGYELCPQFQGKGYMMEAIQKVIRFGFDNMQLKLITACSRFDNNRSIKLLKKNKFTREERQKEKDEDNYELYTLPNPAG